MGRTNPTFRDRLRRLRGEFDDYRRTLRRRDKPHFDSLFEHARAHADAASVHNPDSALAALLLAVALEQEAQLADLRSRVETLERRVADDDCQTTVDAGRSE